MPLGFLIISVAIAKHMAQFAADNNVHHVFLSVCFSVMRTPFQKRNIQFILNFAITCTTKGMFMHLNSEDFNKVIWFTAGKRLEK